MHPACHEYVARTLAGRHFPAVVDLGGRNINGDVNDTYTCDTYVCLDLEPGPGVDVVTDCRDWKPAEPVDLCLSLEVLEHAPEPDEIIAAAATYLKPGGLFVVTAAGPGRAPHSGHDGGAVAAGEYYGNVDPDDLREWLETHFDDVSVEYAPGPCDVRGTGIKPSTGGSDE